MKAIKNVIDFFWPLLPEMDKPQEYPPASKGEIRTIGTDLQSICKAAEKCYDAEFDRMRVIEGKASMFIGTTTFMATFIIGISTFLAKGGTSSFLLITLAVLAFLVCMYMARVLYFAIRTLERSKIWVLNSLDFYKVASLDDYLKEATCQYINATKDMADASVHVLLNVDFKDIIGIEKYSSVHYGVAADGVVDRNHSTGRGGYIPSLGEIRNCHINVGTGKELTIRELSELVVKAVGFEGTVEFDSSKPDGTMRKLIDVSKLHSLGWTHKVEIEDGVAKLFEWYKESLEG